MPEHVKDWVGYGECDVCGAKTDRPCVKRKGIDKGAALFKPHPKRPKDSVVRVARGRKRGIESRAFNNSIGLIGARRS